MFTVEEKILESLGLAPGSSFYKLIRAATGQQQQLRGSAAAQQQGDDAHMQDAEQQQDPSHAALPTEEQQHELQQEAAAAAAVDLGHLPEGGTPPASLASDLRRRSFQGIKRSSETGSAGDAMETDASRGSGSPTILAAAAKRQRGFDGRATDSPRDSPARAAGVAEDEQPLPKALGLPPGSNGAIAGGSSGGGAGGDASALAVLHDYCRKVLKLAAFRLVAVRWGEGMCLRVVTRTDLVPGMDVQLRHVHLSSSIEANSLP